MARVPAAIRFIFVLWVVSGASAILVQCSWVKRRICRVDSSKLAVKLSRHWDISSTRDNDEGWGSGFWGKGPANKEFEFVFIDVDLIILIWYWPPGWSAGRSYWWISREDFPGHSCCLWHSWNCVIFEGDVLVIEQMWRCWFGTYRDTRGQAGGFVRVARQIHHWLRFQGPLAHPPV